jgi:hypothetical protein
MRIAAQILQIAQLAKYRTSSRISQGFAQLIEGGNFMPIKELPEGLQVIFWRIHNEYISLYNRDCQGQYSHIEKAVNVDLIEILKHFHALVQAFILIQLALKCVNL